MSSENIIRHTQPGAIIKNKNYAADAGFAPCADSDKIDFLAKYTKPVVHVLPAILTPYTAILV